MEPLTRQLVSGCLAELATAFPGRVLTPQQMIDRADVYHRTLTGITPDALRFAVREAIQTERFFPKVAQLRELATRWQASRIMMDHAAESLDPLWCRGCQQSVVLTMRWRPRLGLKCVRVIGTDGRLGLESFERHQCSCSAPSQWRPDASDDPWMTPPEGTRWNTVAIPPLLAVEDHPTTSQLVPSVSSGTPSA